MKIEDFVDILKVDFYTGIPDSYLRPLCNYLMLKYGINSQHHIMASNEGNCVGLAAGYYLATGRIPVVYMQNSGEGNIINPVASLLNDKVYAIPMIFIIGWRGEPGVHDEPQHIFQGEITTKLLDTLEIEYFIIDKYTTLEEFKVQYDKFLVLLNRGKSVAFIIKKGTFIFEEKIQYKNNYTMLREEVIRRIVKNSHDDLLVSTTGKASRELFEIREQNGQGHESDFLTVGSMGHTSSIALGLALNNPNRRIWCIDGDASMLMHMGAMAIIGNNSPKNFIHVIINNSAHETVGGMPTVAADIDIAKLAESLKYKNIFSVTTYNDLEFALNSVKIDKVLSLIEVKCGIGSRGNLGRPTTTPIENKNLFMNNM